MAVAARRPGVVTFIGVILYIKAFLAAVAGASLIIFSGNSHVQEETSHNSEALLGYGIGEVIVAVVLLVVARGIMSGSRGFRLFVAIVEGLRMGMAVVAMLVYHTGGFLFWGIITLAFGFFVLWALYAAPGSDEYFSKVEGGGTPAPPPAT